jgi:hypothetical protein
MNATYAARKLDSVLADLGCSVRQAGIVTRYGMGQASEEDVLAVLGHLPTGIVSRVLVLALAAGGGYDTGAPDTSADEDAIRAQDEDADAYRGRLQD